MAPKKQKVKKSKKSKPAAVQDNADQKLVKAGRLKPGEKPDRAILWKKARQTAEGMVVDTGLSDVLKKIKTRKDASKKKDKIEMRNVVAKFKKVEVANSVPNGFNLLYKHATTIMKETGDSIAIPCDVEVFGCDKVIYILHGNLIALLKFEEIGQAAITSHMSYLHGMIRENNEMDVYGFIDPGATFNLNKEFETYVVKRLMNGSYDRMFLMPHNFNYHWILVVIYAGEIFILNPLSHPTHFPHLEKPLLSAFKTFKAQTGRGNTVPKIKNLAWANKSRKSYKMEELDEVRVEALAYIQDKL
ncbi:hypothetical protein ACET3Z_021266 [Daucus carota]